MTENQGYRPSRITAKEVRSRCQDIQDLVNNGYTEEAKLERTQLYLDTLFSISNAPAIADKGQLRRLASYALEASEIRIGGS